MPSPPRSRALDKRAEDLFWKRKILLGAIWEQKQLVESYHALGGPAWLYEDNVQRLKARVQIVQKKLERLGYE